MPNGLGISLTSDVRQVLKGALRHGQKGLIPGVFTRKLYNESPGVV